MSDELSDLVEHVRSKGVDSQGRVFLQHALTVGYSPLVILRRVAAGFALPLPVWVALEDFAAAWCRSEMHLMRLAGSDGSAEWRRVKRWEKVLDESEVTEVNDKFDVRHPADLDIGGEG